jgi:rhamnose transport system substrate-binding protein
MKEIIAGDAKYSKLVDRGVVYGDDEPTKSTTETQNLLTNFPNLEVICCPTTVGILAASQTVESMEDCNVKIAGLGLPSEMKNYVGDDKVCPYMYLWNPIDVGNCAAYAIKAILDGKVGEIGTKFTAENGTTYSITAGDPAEKQIIVGPPFPFTGKNINDWADVY